MWRIGIWGIAGDALWRTWPPKGWGGSPAARVGGLGDDSGVGPPRCLRVQIPCQQTYRSLGSRLARDTPERVFAAGVYSPVAPGVAVSAGRGPGNRGKIGRASCRERVCQYGYIAGVAVSLKKKPYNTR